MSKKLQGMVGKLGFTAVGVVVGMVLVAGTAAAAVQFTRTTASDHSIDVIQSPSHDSAVGIEDSRTSGADDIVPEAPEATEPAQSPEPMDDHSASRDSSADNSGQKTGTDDKAGKSPEPGDDRGRDGSSH